MNRTVLLSILLSGLVFSAAASSTEERGTCTSFCSAEKQQCRSAAERLTDDDTHPLLSMEEKNPLVRNFDPPSAGSEQLQSGRIDAFRNRRMERVHVCEATYLSCTKACSNEPKSNILLKPEPKH